MTVQYQGKVPRLRFQEYHIDWVRRTVAGLLLNYRLGGNYENSDTETNHPLMKMGNLDRGTFNLEKIQFIPEGTIIKQEDKISTHDLFFNTRNTLDLVGKVALWRGELGVAYYNSNLMRLEFENNIFMNYRLNTAASIEALRRVATGTTSVAAIYTRDLLRITLCVPTEPEEQEMIADFLSAVDKKIDLLEKKKELLEQYKKGVMQQVFSQKIRFKDKAGNDYPAQTKVCLKDILVPNPKKPVADTARHKKITIQLHKRGVKFTDTGKRTVDSRPFYARRQGEIIIGKQNFFNGGIAIVGREFDGCICSNAIMSFGVRSGYKNKYIYEYVSASDFMRRREYLAHGTGQKELTEQDFLNFEIMAPTLAEQEKIVDFLSALDKKLGLLTEKLSQMKIWKKGLLQGMFP